jgi:hypothetical protein
MAEVAGPVAVVGPAGGAAWSPSPEQAAASRARATSEPASRGRDRVGRRTARRYRRCPTAACRDPASRPALRSPRPAETHNRLPIPSTGIKGDSDNPTPTLAAARHNRTALQARQRHGRVKSRSALVDRGGVCSVSSLRPVGLNGEHDLSELAATLIGGGLAVACGVLSSQATAVRKRKTRAREERVQAYVDMLGHLESFDRWRRSVAERFGSRSDDRLARAFRESSGDGIPPEVLATAEEFRNQVESELATLVGELDESAARRGHSCSRSGAQVPD